MMAFSRKNPSGPQRLDVFLYRRNNIKSSVYGSVLTAPKYWGFESHPDVRGFFDVFFFKESGNCKSPRPVSCLEALYLSAPS